MYPHYLDGLESENLYFQVLTEEELPYWERFFSIEEACRYFPNPLNLSPAERAKAWFERQWLRYQNGTYGLLALRHKQDGRFLGQSGLLIQEVDGEKILEIGYSLLPENWGKGYASEASQFLRQLVEKERLAQKVYSIIHIENNASQAVAIRNGMAIERQTLFFDIPVYLFACAIPS